MIYSGLYVEDGVIKTKIMISETNSKDIKKEFVCDNCIISEIKYLSNGNIVCIGDTSSYIILDKSYEIKKIPYNNMILSNTQLSISSLKTFLL